MHKIHNWLYCSSVQQDHILCTLGNYDVSGGNPKACLHEFVEQNPHSTTVNQTFC